ncbi:substrate-binding domain-containing protein [Paenibacillus thalictri]|uniref:GntR family transcriptional regulator n=1 Tax=Paenibacillus thalictri TaxID=2527873 RepID=A0A4V2J498_9BACL|nr:substrate-binding domain-containing protein [Paenibacillus thalictri]TBL78611.1 GntR family transcriptional regulator [Paenibacillus thalictri]
MNRDFTPTYYSIKRNIKDQIARNILQPGELLPGRKAMCELYDCSWSTLNRAVNELILEGVLTAEKGKGTYVSSRPQPGAAGGEQPKTLNVWLCNPYPSVYGMISEMMDGMREEAHQRGVSIRFLDLVDSAIPKELDEYIVVTPSNEQLVSLIEAYEYGSRFVVVNSSWQGAPYPCIDADIFGAVSEATSLLLHKGHRNIGLLGIRSGLSNYERRVDAFRGAFLQGGLPLSDEWIVGRPENREEAKKLYGEWLDRHSEVTALFAADYATTLILLELLAEKNIKVPQQISLFTVGAPRFASLQNTPISTIVQPFYEMGRLSVVRLLERQMTGGTELLACKLLMGDSVSTV